MKKGEVLYSSCTLMKNSIRKPIPVSGGSLKSSTSRVRFSGKKGTFTDASDTYHEEPEIHDSTFSLKAIKDVKEKEDRSARAIRSELLGTNMSNTGKGTKEFNNPLFQTAKDIPLFKSIRDNEKEETTRTEVSETSEPAEEVAPAPPSLSHADHALVQDIREENSNNYIRILGISKYDANQTFMVPPIQEDISTYEDELASDYVQRTLKGLPPVDLDVSPKSTFSKYLRESISRNSSSQRTPLEPQRHAASGPNSTLLHHMGSQTDVITKQDEEDHVQEEKTLLLLDLYDRLMSEKTDLEKLPGKIKTMEGTQLALIASEYANIEAREENLDAAKLSFQNDHAKCLAELLQLANTIRSRQNKIRQEEDQLNRMEKELNRLNAEAQSHLSFLEKNKLTMMQT